MSDLTAPKNEFEETLQQRKNALIAQVDSDRRLLAGQSLFDLRTVYLAELDRNKLPYTEFDTKDKFIDMIIFLTHRKLETLWIEATAIGVKDGTQLEGWLARIDEIEHDWQEKLWRSDS